jgi:hypothetical protein
VLVGYEIAWQRAVLTALGALFLGAAFLLVLALAAGAFLVVAALVALAALGAAFALVAVFFAAGAFFVVALVAFFASAGDSSFLAAFLAAGFSAASGFASFTGPEAPMIDDVSNDAQWGQESEATTRWASFVTAQWLCEGQHHDM